MIIMLFGLIPPLPTLKRHVPQKRSRVVSPSSSCSLNSCVVTVVVQLLVAGRSVVRVVSEKRFVLYSFIKRFGGPLIVAGRFNFIVFAVQLSNCFVT